MPSPLEVSSFFGAEHSSVPTSVRLVDGDHEILNQVRGHLAALGLPSTRGEVLRVAIREGLEVLMGRLEAQKGGA